MNPAGRQNIESDTVGSIKAVDDCAIGRGELLPGPASEKMAPLGATAPEDSHARVA
jgi:hypothetical protein